LIRHWSAALGMILLMLGASNCIRAQNYDFRGITNSINEFDTAFPIRGNFSGQVDAQIATQSAYIDQNANPFKYVQRYHIRPWIFYNGFKNTQLGFSTSYQHKFDVPAVGAKHSDEVRVTFMGTFTQPQSFGSIYEQVRVEIRNVRDSGGDWSHFPRFRLRFGQNIDIERREKKRRLVMYQEIAFKAREDQKAVDSVRVFFGHLYRPTPRLAITTGFLTQAVLKSNGRDVDVYFGPKISVKYTFGKQKPRKQSDEDVNQ
jgi:hypothetical protein